MGNFCKIITVSVSDNITKQRHYRKNYNHKCCTYTKVHNLHRAKGSMAACLLMSIVMDRLSLSAYILCTFSLLMKLYFRNISCMHSTISRNCTCNSSAHTKYVNSHTQHTMGGSQPLTVFAILNSS
jgi:hypothetical protein